MARALLGCGTSQPSTQNMTLADFSRDGNGALGVSVDRDAGLVQGAMTPYGSGDSLGYLSALPCPLLHVQATVNGVECSASTGGANPGPSGLSECIVPTFTCSSIAISSDINIRVWDNSETWILEGDLPVPIGRLVGGDTVHVGTWADVTLSQPPDNPTDLTFLPDSGAPGFEYKASDSDGGCEVSYVDDADGGAPLPPDAACPLILKTGGASFWVPDTPGAGTLVVAGYPYKEITDCEGPAKCVLSAGYGTDPTARVPIRIVP